MDLVANLSTDVLPCICIKGFFLSQKLTCPKVYYQLDFNFINSQPKIIIFFIFNTCYYDLGTYSGLPSLYLEQFPKLPGDLERLQKQGRY